MDSKVTVAVRCRPLMPREERNGAESVVVLEDRRVAVGDPVELAARGSSPILGRNFAFDLVLGGDSQAEVHETLGVPLLRHAWRGLNASIFAYGQTGSGKTYSMTGGDGEHEASFLGCAKVVGRRRCSFLLRDHGRSSNGGIQRTVRIYWCRPEDLSKSENTRRRVPACLN